MLTLRLSLMSLDELLNVVRPSTLVSPDAILDAIKVKNECKDMELKYRGYLSKYLICVARHRVLWYDINPGITPGGVSLLHCKKKK